MVTTNKISRIGNQLRRNLFPKWDARLHPRDRSGRWVRSPIGRKVSDLPVYQPDGLETKVPRVRALAHALHSRGYSLHEAIDHYHWFKGSSSAGGGSPYRRISFVSKWPSPGKDLPTSDKVNPYDKDYPDAKRFSEEVIHLLSEKEEDTLSRLTYGAISPQWGREKAYTDHLRAWAKDSKLVDADRLPIRLFHGTGSGFTTFDPGKWGELTGKDDARHAFFFTSSPEDAGYFAFYGVAELHRQDQQPNIMPVHVRLKNPLVVADRSGLMDMTLFENVIIYASEHGFDGMVCYNGELPKDAKVQRLADRVPDLEFTKQNLYVTNGPLVNVPGMTVCCFRPQDIKSAIGNNGDFDESANIGKSSLLLLEDEMYHGSLFKSRSQGAETNSITAGTKIRYRHPNYPSLVREGKVICSGRDGCLVLHSPSNHEERVRHTDIIHGDDKKAKKDKAIEKSFGKPAASPKQSSGLEVPTTVRRLPFQTGHAVTYQRPDMGEPSTGKIEAIGQHGAVISRADGARHKVRWEHVQGRTHAGIEESVRGDAVDVLREMGLPMDELDSLLTPSRKPRADSALLDQLNVLASGGAPIDLKRAKDAPRKSLERLRDYLTTSDGAL